MVDRKIENKSKWKHQSTFMILNEYQGYVCGTDMVDKCLLLVCTPTKDHNLHLPTKSKDGRL